MTWRAVSSSNAPYEAKTRPFLESLVRAGLPAAPIHLTVDYDVTDPVEGVEYRRFDSATSRAPSPIACVQHGDFLDVVPDVDLILLTDCDITMQRPLEGWEQLLIERVTEGQVWCSWNNGEGDSLFHEAWRLQPREQIELVIDGNTGVGHFCGFPISRHPMYLSIYNTGVLAMRRQTWQRVYDVYTRVWTQAERVWAHHARQQWVLSWIFSRLKLDVWTWPETFHAHGCFNMVRPIPRRFQWIGDQLTVSGDPVAFRHNWEAP